MKHKQIISIVIIIVLILSISGCGISKDKEQYNQNIEHATKAYENLNSAYTILRRSNHDVCTAWEESVARGKNFSFHIICMSLNGVTEEEVVEGFVNSMNVFITDWDEVENKEEEEEEIRQDPDLHVRFFNEVYGIDTYKTCVLSVLAAYSAEGGQFDHFQEYMYNAKQEISQIQLLNKSRYKEDYYTVLRDYYTALRDEYKSGDTVSIDKSLSDVRSAIDDFNNEIESYQYELKDDLGVSEDQSKETVGSLETEDSKQESVKIGSGETTEIESRNIDSSETNQKAEVVENTKQEGSLLKGATKIQTSDGDFNIDVKNVHTVDWKVDNAGMKVVTIQAEVENISYSGYEDNKIQYYEIVNSGVSLLDEDGFALEFYSIGGVSDGKYEVRAIVDIGSKKRVSLPFWVPEECNTVSVSVDGHVSDPIILNN